MASGKAIIASDLQVLKEVLKDGRNALLAGAGNVREREDSLERLSDWTGTQKTAG